MCLCYVCVRLHGVLKGDQLIHITNYKPAVIQKGHLFPCLAKVYLSSLMLLDVEFKYTVKQIIFALQ